MTQPEPGWYPHPGTGTTRWWDGNQWTQHTQAVAPPVPPSPDTPQRTATLPPPPPVPQQPLPPPPPQNPPPPPSQDSPPDQTLPPPAQGPAGSSQVPTGLLAKEKRGLIGGRKGLEAENEQLRLALEAIGVGERDRLLAEIGAANQQLQELRGELGVLSTEVIETRETAMLQEVGIYQYQHPLTDALGFKDQLGSLQAEIKKVVKDKQAVLGATNWTVNNSTAEGSRMVADFCKLMARAYNNEADNLVRSLNGEPRVFRTAIVLMSYAALFSAT